MIKTASILLSIFISISSAAQLQGKVIAVMDGDTFKILSADNNQLRVRLYGVDAPEKKQAFSTRSAAYLSRLIFNKMVLLDTKYRDRYGRWVAIAKVAGLNINEALLKAGYVWHYKQYDKSSVWAGFEMEARSGRRGLWADAHPIPPWQFRGIKRTR